MQRGSDKHGPVQDDQLKRELRGMEQANRPTRAEEWRDPEPPADDDPQLRDPRGGAMTPQSVGNVMTPEVIGVSPSAPVTEAAEMMREYDVGDVLVVEDGRAQGIVTDRDLAVRVLAAHREPESTTVREICSEDLISVLPDVPVSEAVGLMREHAIRRLPVIAADGQPQGVVTIGDLAVAEDPKSALADISAAPPNM